MTETNFPKWRALALAGVLAAVCLVALLIPSRAVRATDASGFSGTTLVKSLFSDLDVKSHTDPHHKVKLETKGFSDVYIQSNVVIPGGHSGWHSHPGPSVVLVKSGTAVVYSGSDPSCTGRAYPAGAGFIDEGGEHIHMVRNEGATNLELFAFQMLPAGAPRRIDKPAPGNCPF